MRKSIRKSLFVFLVLILALTLVACGGNNNVAKNTSGGETAPEKTEPVKPAEPVTINVLTQSIEPKELIEKFKLENPNINVKWETVDTANISQTMKTRIAAGGENLDLMTPQKADFVPLAEAGAFMDLTGEGFLANYDQIAVNAGTLNNKVLGIPLTQQAYLVWYNKDIFKANNINEPKNWEEFLAACEVLKKAGIAPIVLAGKEEWVVNVFAGLSYSGLFSQEPQWLSKAAKGEVKWTDEGSLNALNKVKTIVDKGYLLEGALGTGYDQAYQAFYQGQAAMTVNGAWSIDLIVKNAPAFEVGAFVPPGNNAGDPLKVAFTPGNTIAISSKTENPEASKTFLDFLSKPENATIFATALKQFSSAKGASADFHPATKLIIPILATEKSQMLHANVTPTTNSVLGKALQKLIAKEATPEEAAKEIQGAQDKDIK